MNTNSHVKVLFPRSNSDTFLENMNAIADCSGKLLEAGLSYYPCRDSGKRSQSSAILNDILLVFNKHDCNVAMHYHYLFVTLLDEHKFAC